MKSKTNKYHKVERIFNEISITYLILIFISILFSITIALQADISDSSGHGGLIYIIGPGLLGLLIIIFYLISLFISPKSNTILGITSIVINIIIGFIFMFTEF